MNQMSFSINFRYLIMELELMKNIMINFDVFQSLTKDSKSSGIGLSIVKKIINLYGEKFGWRVNSENHILFYN